MFNVYPTLEQSKRRILFELESNLEDFNAKEECNIDNL